MVTSSCIVYVNDDVDNEDEEDEIPEVAGDLESMEVVGGENAELRALIYCNKPTDVAWYFKDQKLEKSDKYEMGCEKEEYFLIVNKCSADDSGEYRLDVKNAQGVATTDCLLEVLPEEKPPQIMVIPECEGKMEQFDGEDLRLEFDFESESPVTVEWMKNGKKIKPAKNIEMVSDEVMAYLNIEKAGVKDSGKYKAIVQNAVGKEEVSFEVEITGKFIFDPFSFFYSRQDFNITVMKQLS